MQVVPQGFGSVAEGVCTERGDHSLVARIPVGQHDWEARADPVGQLVEDAKVPGDEDALARPAVHVLRY